MRRRRFAAGSDRVDGNDGRALTAHYGPASAERAGRDPAGRLERWEAMGSKTVNIQCTYCGHEGEQPVATLRTLTELTCPHCGRPIRLDRNETLRDLDDVDESWKEIFGSVDDKDP